MGQVQQSDYDRLNEFVAGCVRKIVAANFPPPLPVALSPSGAASGNGYHRAAYMMRTVEKRLAAVRRFNKARQRR